MSQVAVVPDFSNCGCTVSVAVTVTQNPVMYYNGTKGSPTSQGIIPPNAGLPAIIFEQNGSGPGYVFNPATATWN